MTSFAYRLLGSFWMMVGVLFGAVTVVYILVFDRISSATIDLLGDSAPLVNFLAARLGPGFLNWWGLGLAVFLILLGVRLLALAPVARPVAMAFHLLAGLFILAVTLVLFMAVNRAIGIIGLVAPEAGNVVLYVGLGLSLLLLGLGAGLGTKSAWDAFTTTGGGANIVGVKPQQAADDAPAVRTARLINLDTGESFPLKANAGQIAIGSGPTQTIVLDEIGVSNCHAFIEYDGNEFLLRDNTSTNGTFVNGEKIIVLPKRLRDNDEIQLGPARLRFES